MQRTDSLEKTLMLRKIEGRRRRGRQRMRRLDGSTNLMDMSLSKLRELVMPPNHLVLCRPLLLLTSIFPSIRVFYNELALRIRWPEYWNFRLSINPSSEYSGLISFRIDWFDFLAVQVIFKILSSPTPWFKSINSLAFGLLYGPTLTSIHAYL